MADTTTSPDLAPPGCAWVLAKVEARSADCRPYLQTLPQHGYFPSRSQALHRADAVRQGDQVLAILVEVPAAAVELAIEGSA